MHGVVQALTPSLHYRREGRERKGGSSSLQPVGSCQAINARNVLVLQGEEGEAMASGVIIAGEEGEARTIRMILSMRADGEAGTVRKRVHKTHGGCKASSPLP